MRMKLCVTILIMSLTSATWAQEMLVNGSFDNADGWTVTHLDGYTPLEADFVENDIDGPAAGNGPFLEISGEGQYLNIVIWQELTLVAGTTYEFSGAFKDMTEGELQGVWAEIYLSTEAPVEGVDYAPIGGENTDILTNFSSWDEPCLPTVDGTFQDNGCGTTQYTPAGDAGEEVTIYFAFKTGQWVDYGSSLFYVAVDEFSLVPVGDSAVKSGPAQVQDFALYPNFPNPFNPSTTIRFSLSAQSPVELSILDVNGHTVNTLLQGTLNEGSYSIFWDGQDQSGLLLPSGTYLYRLEADQFSETRRMILIK